MRIQAGDPVARYFGLRRGQVWYAVLSHFCFARSTICMYQKVHAVTISFGTEFSFFFRLPVAFLFYLHDCWLLQLRKSSPFCIHSVVGCSSHFRAGLVFSLTFFPVVFVTLYYVSRSVSPSKSLLRENHLPRMQESDPVARYFGVRRGQVHLVLLFWCFGFLFTALLRSL
jgi:DNA-directed RNA polymerase subunit H (RpoH/RPB5)